MPFRRINFFKGLFTKADDWRQAEAYHIGRRRLHNRTLHSPGVINGLDVTVIDEGRKVKVTGGHAIAPDGQEIWLESDVTVDVFPADPGTLYLVLRSADKEVDYRQDVGNTEYSGNAFVEEQAAVAFETAPPGLNESAIVIARIKLAREAKRVIDPGPTEDPHDNELDRRGVPQAGSLRARMGLKDIAEKTPFGELDIKIDPGQERERGWKSHASEGAFYLAIVRPIEGQQGKVSWRFGTRRDPDGALQYALFIRNDSDHTLRVSWEVYRLLWG